MLLWACIGKIDIVATASGKIIPSGKSKVIQSSETAVVKAIHVVDGQQVKAGDLLLELDSTSAEADVGHVTSDLLAARIDKARAGAMLDAINSKRLPQALVGMIDGADPVQSLAAERWVQGQYQEYRSSLDTASAEIQQRLADMQSARVQVASLQKSLPIAAKLADDYRHLLDKQYIARHAYLEKEQARLDIIDNSAFSRPASCNPPLRTKRQSDVLIIVAKRAVRCSICCSSPVRRSAHSHKIWRKLNIRMTLLHLKKRR